MGNFRRDNKSFGRDRGSSRGGFGGRSFGGRDRRRDSGFGSRRPEMHEVTCDKCGEQCKVPFKPTGDKPVYCSKCFEGQGNSSGNRRSFSDSSSTSSGNGISQEQFKELNSKLDKILEILDMIEFEEDEEAEESEDAA